MIPLAITLNIEKEPWKDMKQDLAAQGDFYAITRIGRLPKGTKEGNSTVSIVMEGPDGKKYAGQTTLRLIALAVRSLVISAQMEGEFVND